MNNLGREANEENIERAQEMRDYLRSMPAMLSAKDLAELTGEHIGSIRRGIHDGRIPADKINGRWYIPTPFMLENTFAFLRKQNERRGAAGSREARRRGVGRTGVGRGEYGFGGFSAFAGDGDGGRGCGVAVACADEDVKHGLPGQGGFGVGAAGVGAAVAAGLPQVMGTGFVAGATHGFVPGVGLVPIVRTAGLPPDAGLGGVAAGGCGAFVIEAEAVDEPEPSAEGAGAFVGNGGAWDAKAGGEE